ncbi:hypothetical protein ACIBG7_42595 [Nonomuraea sp. NPDC050328]|uniref:hypothetical protein n=1 Tax=Nonomuraea sp. NPDC050328 TaxID=3364361 RepID=UPI0037A34BC4
MIWQCQHLQARDVVDLSMGRQVDLDLGVRGLQQHPEQASAADARAVQEIERL